MSLAVEFLDELKTRVGLAAVIGRKLRLVRAGRELKGCCPFHGEKTPSFFVSEDKGFYHCFGCGAHGDVIRFVMESDGLSFIDAVRLLAQEAGMEMPAEPVADRQQQHRAGLRQLVEAAGDWFANRLQSIAGQAARQYLARRGVSEELARHFGLGFAPASRHALQQQLQTQFPASRPEQWLEAGLVGENSGQRRDRFRNRLIFPIHDGRGRMVGFGGRLLGEGQPKYLNSADGPLFHKGSLLFNYHRAAAAARKNSRLLIVEGYMDVIGLAGVGVAEAVAPLGTALTERQMLLAWRLVAEPVLAFDADAAGQRAALRAATNALPLIAAGKSLRFAFLPAGQDPDDLARSGGKAAIEQLFAKAVSLERFLFEAEQTATPLDTPERRAALRQRLQALASDIAEPQLRRDYIATWQARTEALLRPAPRRRTQQRRSGQFRGAAHPLRPLRPETRAEMALPTEIHMAMLLKLLAGQPELTEYFLEQLAELPLRSPALSRARDHLLAGQDTGELLAGYRPLSFGEVDAATLRRKITLTLAQCLAPHQISAPMGAGASERQAAVAADESAQAELSELSAADRSLADAFARNRAVALDMMQRRDIARQADIGDPQEPAGQQRQPLAKE